MRRAAILAWRAMPATLAAGLLVAAGGASAAGFLDRMREAVEAVEKVVPAAPATAPPQQVAPASPAPAATSDKADDDTAGQLLVQALLADRLTPQQETQIGARIAGNLLGAAPLADDLATQQYVHRVGMLVAAQSGRPELPWRFGVLASDDVNAFAAPGGFVFVTAGLYRLLDDEAELAAVLGHEIAHVVLRHHLEVMKKSSVIGAVSTALSNRLSATRPNLTSVLGNGAQILARGLDKEAELAADRLGIVLAARAGYDPYAMFGVLEKIAAAAAADAGPVALLYSTHPHPDVRLDALGSAAGTHFDALPPGGTAAARFHRLPGAG
jgi:predicted Zn-dependent protease